MIDLGATSVGLYIFAAHVVGVGSRRQSRAWINVPCLVPRAISHAMVGHVAVVSHERQSEHNGTVMKTP